MSRSRVIVAAVLAIAAVAAITGGVAYAVSGTSPISAPRVEPSVGVVELPTTGTTDLTVESEASATKPQAAIDVLPIVEKPPTTEAPPIVAKPQVAKPEAAVAKKKTAKPVTGAVVRDPDDCGDTCVNSKLDADDCGMDHCSDDVDPGAASGASAIDDDGDGDGGDCGDAD